MEILIAKMGRIRKKQVSERIRFIFVYSEVEMLMYLRERYEMGSRYMNLEFRVKV